MRWLGAVTALAALGAAASWGGGTLLARQAAEGFARLAAEGRGGAASVSATGFPLRIGAEVTAPALDFPEAGGRWQAPSAELAAPLWAPLDWRIAATAPQKLTLAGQRFTLAATDSVATLGLGLGAALPLRRATLTLDTPRLSAENASTPALAAQDVTATATRAGDGRWQIVAGARAVALPEGLTDSLAPGAGLPDVIETVTVDATASLDTPPALMADRMPALTALDLTRVHLAWGGRALDARGAITIDADGRPEGTITLSTKDWAAWLQVAVAAGLVEAKRVPMLATLGAYLAQQSKDGAVEVPLAFAQGRMSLGPVPLGRAPVLVQRQ